VIGGGLPVGAFARGEIMNFLSIRSRISSWTLSGNPLAMAAGLTMLQSLNEDQEVLID
jgi:glutamate-1-semialdehyde 2,1-aminomutase